MFLGTSSDMHEIDKRAYEKYHIPSVVLMENAAFAIVNRIKKHNKSKILFVCGPGNNGGDGFAAARQLACEGYCVKVFLLSDENKFKGDAKINYDALSAMNAEIYHGTVDLKNEIEKCDIVVDCIFGTGLKRNIEGAFNDAIKIINNEDAFVLSVDIPSGIDSDTGRMLNICINADETVTFGCKKPGLVLGEGRNASGSVVVSQISIPYGCIEEQNIKCTTNYGDYPDSLLIKRKTDTNKGDYGKVFIFGGSHLMSGAVGLSGDAALRSGSGLVNCVVPESIIGRVSSFLREAVYTSCSEENGCAVYSREILEKAAKKGTAIAFGVGVSISGSIKNSLEFLIENSTVPLVIDADGLNNLCSIKDVLLKKSCGIVLTPHPGEMSRLTGIDIKTINENRVEVARDFAIKYGCIVLLKGSSTVVTDGDRTYINTTGNPGMASAGSGDVLTGIIVSLIGQGYGLYDSAVLGAYIHGAAGDLAYKKYGYGIKAGDIAECVAEVMKEMIRE